MIFKEIKDLKQPVANSQLQNPPCLNCLFEQSGIGKPMQLEASSIHTADMFAQVSHSRLHFLLPLECYQEASTGWKLTPMYFFNSSICKK